MLAGNFVPLPALGWSADQIALLIHGQPIERMLRHYAISADQPEPGKFHHTGGWTSPDMVRNLKLEFNDVVSGGPLPTNDAAQPPWELLNESKALDDARAVLAPLGDNDWLVMAITH
jgi:hypothetical protein